MRNLLISCFLTVCCSIAHAGAYEDILSAAGNDDTATVTSLLQRGMDVNTADRSGNTLLMIASRNGNLALMKSLIAARANVNRRNQHGDTALLLAALKPAPEAARLLVENGADLNPSGWTPLHYSILSGSTGAGNRNRTGDLPLTRRLLYHLSYAGSRADYSGADPL
jgi:ankyrin repeat protein